MARSWRSPREGEDPLAQGRVVGKEQYGWGGLGGSALWFNPVDQIGFGYTVTGASFGLAGDPGRLGPIYAALNSALGTSPGASASARPRL